MQCGSCGFTNPESAKFCQDCGQRLSLLCPSCGRQMTPTAKFCFECGTPLVGAPMSLSKDRPPVAPRRAPEAERRQLTVMFCDLVGSTALSAQLDPEELREIVRAYQVSCAEVIRRYDGHIAQHLGDGLLVYFGYPTAHEDDARRAVRAGLEIVTTLHARGAGTMHPSPLHVRIGMHTGLVVIGEIGSSEKREILALGKTPNIAARVQGIANPDEVMISATTYQLVEGLFACEERGQPELKGVTTLLTLYRVVKESEAQGRFQVVTRKGLTPLVGRDHEYGLLRERWERVKDGAGQVVLLSGEPGIGKSRLVQVLKERIATEQHTRLEYHCSPYHQNSALYPVIELFQRVLQFQREDSPEGKLRKLERALEPYGFALPEMVSLFAALLSLPLPERYPPLTFTPEKQKEKTRQAIITGLLKEAERQSLFLAWEDLHWADPSTLELLDLLIAQAPMTRMYLLLTFRPEFIPPWTNRSHLTPLTLSRLPHTEAEVMVRQVTGGKALPAEVVQQIVAKTDGVPLFVEELTKMVVESGLVRATNEHYELAGPLPPLAIPSTLQDSLMARLDRLATTREIAQMGATLGREFSYEVLQVISPLDEETLQRGLKQLVEAELLYQRGLPPQATYLFKHALVQDTAYHSLLKSKRQLLHQQIARALEERFPETIETQPELVAHHYTEAGLIEQAIPYWQRGGQSAIKRSAHVEAISHLTTGLELLTTLPDTPLRRQHELALQAALGVPLLRTKGYAAPEVAHAYGRARELCHQIGEQPELFTALAGLCSFYLVRAELQAARLLAEQCLHLAQHAQDPALLVEAHFILGVTLFYSGELTAAQAILEQGSVFYDPQAHGSLTVVYGQDPGVGCRSYASLASWFLGYPDQALGKSHDALSLARELSHSFSVGAALQAAAWVRQYRQERHAVQAYAEEELVLSKEEGFALWLAVGMIQRGWALSEQGEKEQGLAQMHEGRTTLNATGAKLSQPYHLALLAQTYGKSGRPHEGLVLVDQALVAVDKTGERYYEAELYRLKGELSLQSEARSPRSEVTNPQSLISNPQSEAEECFHKAIDIARKQSAKSLELRAVMSLARLWQQHGKQREAHALLSEIYNWFTEGFDTKDLQEAKALLEELH